MARAAPTHAATLCGHVAEAPHRSIMRPVIQYPITFHAAPGPLGYSYWATRDVTRNARRFI